MLSTYITPKLREGETIDLSLYSPRERTNIRLYGLACKDWTPRDVFEYKNKWMGSSPESIKTFTLDAAKAWCKNNLYMQDWHVEKHGSPDDKHVFYFKNPNEAFLFKLSVDCL